MKAGLFWIPGPWRGRLAIVGRPRGGDWPDDEAAAWRRAGIDVVVSLLEDVEAQLGLIDERRAAEGQGVSFVAFPIPDRGAPASTEAAIVVVGRIAAELKAGNNNVAVHCRQGVGRSGLIAAGVLMNSGLPAEQALETVSSARGISVPETREQRRWIEELPSGVPVSKESGNGRLP